MSRDNTYTYVHMHEPRHVDFWEDFCRDRMPQDEIYVPPQHQPLNPEDEDDVVPDQHAAFGIQKATQRSHEPAWKDLALAELMMNKPGKGQGRGSLAGPSATFKPSYKGMPR